MLELIFLIDLQFPLLKPIHTVLKQNIVSKPLLKIFSVYRVVNHKCWFHGLGKITTDSILRQIIPINEKTGLILISYTDGNDILPFMNEQVPKSNREIRKIINNELKHLFPQLQIPKPRQIFSADTRYLSFTVFLLTNDLSVGE